MEAPRDDLIRFQPVESRASLADGNTLTGYPIVFDTWTEINGYEGNFKERIAPSAVSKTLRESRDKIKILFNHGMDPQIGDKPLGKASVMRADEKGVYLEVPLSDTSYNRDIKALLQDGAIDGQSFRFSVVKEDWNKPKRGLPERTITELRLYEMGPVTFPAYEATSVGIRSREALAEWRDLSEEQREAFRLIRSGVIDLSTLTEAALSTSDNESRDDDTEEPAPSHSEATNRKSALHREVLRLRARELGVIQ